MTRAQRIAARHLSEKAQLLLELAIAARVRAGEAVQEVVADMRAHFEAIKALSRVLEVDKETKLKDGP